MNDSRGGEREMAMYGVDEFLRNMKRTYLLYCHAVSETIMSETITYIQMS
jgi:hypothetical protein